MWLTKFDENKVVGADDLIEVGVRAHNDTILKLKGAHGSHEGQQQELGTHHLPQMTTTTL
jgi:hypothetical protein